MIKEPRRNRVKLHCCQRIEELEIIESAPEVLPLKRKAAVFEPTVNGCHPISRVGDCYSRSKNFWGENYGAIRQPQLRVFKMVGVRLALFVFSAVTKVDREAGGELLVVFKITPSLSTETFFKISGWKPDQRA